MGCILKSGRKIPGGSKRANEKRVKSKDKVLMPEGDDSRKKEFDNGVGTRHTNNERLQRTWFNQVL
jgi:hypothetical protein